MDVQAHIDRLLEMLPELAATEITVTDPAAHAELCTKVGRAISGLQHFRSRILAEGARAQVDRQLGATSMGALVARRHGGDRHAADAETRRGEDLLALPVTQRAAGLGDLTPQQANTIAGTIKKLPEHLSPDQRTDCEKFLVDIARKHSMRGLRTACDRISAQWLASDREVDIAEGDVLKTREERARQAAEFCMVDQGDGTHRGWFVVPEVQADLLRTALEALAAPRRDHLNGFDDQITSRHRLGQAFTALCDHVPADKLPQNAGMAAKLVVTIDQDSLTSGRGVAQLATGTRLSASQARIIAANSGIVPAVLGGKSVVLDLGRSQRLFSEAQRTAMIVRDGGCTFPGCERPPAWCEAHHAKKAWAQGGRTDLADGTLLCWHHHRHVERHDWHHRLAPDGIVEWIPPPQIDPQREPRRNRRHRREPSLRR